MSEMEETLAFPQWLDLPEPLAELVLERLPLVDYIHFATVCRKWRLIQRGHRLRYAPHPPPMANQLPWLVPLYDPHQALEFYSLSDRKSYRLPIPSSLHKSRCLASCHGWLLLLEYSFSSTPTSKQPLLTNPITAVQIPLPPFSFTFACHVIGAMSTTPADPDCIVLLVFDCCAFLYRPNDHYATDWTIIQLPARWGLYEGSAIYCGGKFYCSYNNADELYVIDPFLHEAASQLAMRYPYGASTKSIRVSLHKIGGELFSVRILYGAGAVLYRAFKADLPRQEWVSVETVGDHVLFHYGDCSVLLFAADVGYKRNSIHVCKSRLRGGELGHVVSTWGSFEFGIGDWTEVDTLPNVYFGPWFLPTLDSTNLARANN